MLDSQRIVDNKIKNSCELFINYSVRLILKRLPLVRNQLINCTKIINSNENGFKLKEKGTRLDSALDSTLLTSKEEEINAIQNDQQTNSNQVETIDAVKSVQQNEANESSKLNDKNKANNDKIEDNELKKNEKENDQLMNDTNKLTVIEERQQTVVAEQCLVRNFEQNVEQQQQLNSVQQLVNDLNELIKESNEQVIAIQKSMKIYLSSEDTEAILFKPVKNQIVKSIEALFSQLALVFNDQEWLLNNECQFTNAKIALESIFNTNKNFTN